MAGVTVVAMAFARLWPRFFCDIFLPSGLAARGLFFVRCPVAVELRQRAGDRAGPVLARNRLCPGSLRAVWPCGRLNNRPQGRGPCEAFCELLYRDRFSRESATQTGPILSPPDSR